MGVEQRLELCAGQSHGGFVEIRFFFAFSSGVYCSAFQGIKPSLDDRWSAADEPAGDVEWQTLFVPGADLLHPRARRARALRFDRRGHRSHREVGPLFCAMLSLRRRQLAGLAAHNEVTRRCSEHIGFAKPNVSSVAVSTVCVMTDLPHSFTIGRAKDCDVVLADESVSRRHAELIVDGPQLTLIDCRSTRGTRLVHRGRVTAITHAAVPLGAVIRFGDLELSVQEILDAIRARHPSLSSPLPGDTAPSPAARPSRLRRCACGTILRADSRCPECET